MGKYTDTRVRLGKEAYEHLKLVLQLNPELDQQTIVSETLIKFLNASIRSPALKWHQDKGLFELYSRGWFLDLEIYLKTGRAIKEPLIDALLDIADGTTWKKFAETLCKFEEEHGIR